MAVRVGLEELRDDGFRLLAGLHVGLFTNPSAVDRRLRRAIDVLHEAPQVNLTALFSPEHGLAAAAPDAERVASSHEPRTGLPVYSLYDESLRPSAAMLSDVDVIVCDIQDVGVRYYTYVWTITHLLEAASAHGVAVVILDRPNPLGGEVVVGSPLQSGFESLVGRFSTPIVHGLTLGELAALCNAAWNPSPAELMIVPCRGWQRSMTWAQTGRPWVPTSPAMPHWSTVLHYPGACLVEGTRLSEGRGTALPFEVVGAPWIEPIDLADQLNTHAWAGVRFRPHSFIPTASKWRGETCHGVQAHITDAMSFRPVEVWLGVIRTIRLSYAKQFEWLPPGSVGVEGGTIFHFDRLVGSDVPRHQIDDGSPLAEITDGWEAFCEAFREQRRPYLLYE